jgi:uncharacterized protein (DUF2267 family)
MRGLHVFDSYLTVANTWMAFVVKELEMAPGEHPRAVLALRAGLHAIRDRLPAAEAVDLAAQLPTIMRGIYFEGWKVTNDPTRIRDRPALLARVKQELKTDDGLDPTNVLRAVIRLLVKYVSPGKIEDVVATLPAPLAELWEELSQPATERLLGRAAPLHLWRRTGYAL